MSEVYYFINGGDLIVSFNMKEELNFDMKKQDVNENVLIKYGEKAAQMALTPISMSESNTLMPIEIEMCYEIFKNWEIDKYKTDVDYILNNSVLSNRDKFIYRILLGKILRLIPAGVTILSVGINASLAKRFTLALGYAISELNATYISEVINDKEVDVLDIFTKEAIEDLMESYLIEYNKTVLN